MNVERLEALERELRRRNPTLYMQSWATCACGWAAKNMPEFNLLGFRWDDDRLCITYGNMPATSLYPDGCNSGYATRAFFDLDASHSLYLFTIVGSGGQPMQTGIEVADRIRHVLRLRARVQAAHELAKIKETTTPHLDSLERAMQALSDAFQPIIERLQARHEAHRQQLRALREREEETA